MTKTWTMSETQKDFVAVVSNFADGATLLEIKLATGKDFKTGSINTLITKGIVSVDADKRNFECDVVYNGHVIGKVTKPYSVYRVVAKAE